jgi:hypothetical protein
MREDHWSKAFGAEMGPNCYAAWVKQDVFLRGRPPC